MSRLATFASGTMGAASMSGHARDSQDPASPASMGVPVVASDPVSPMPASPPLGMLVSGPPLSLVGTPATRLDGLQATISLAPTVIATPQDNHRPIVGISRLYLECRAREDSVTKSHGPAQEPRTRATSGARAWSRSTF